MSEPSNTAEMLHALIYEVPKSRHRTRLIESLAVLLCELEYLQRMALCEALRAQGNYVKRHKLPKKAMWPESFSRTLMKAIKVQSGNFGQKGFIESLDAKFAARKAECFKQRPSKRPVKS